MNELEFLRRQLATEERNLAAVTAACAAALAPERDPPADPEFLQACAEYLASAGRRASERGAAHAALLRASPDGAAAAGGALLAALDSTVAAQRQALAQLGQVRVAAGLSLAEGLGRCLAGLAALPAARRVALDERVERRYGISEWRITALVDADAILEERELFGRVAGCLPDGTLLATASPTTG